MDHIFLYTDKRQLSRINTVGRINRSGGGLGTTLGI